MLSFSIWFSAPSFWLGGGLQSRCVGSVYGADGARPDTAAEVQASCLHLTSNQQQLENRTAYVVTKC